MIVVVCIRKFVFKSEQDRIVSYRIVLYSLKSIIVVVLCCVVCVVCVVLCCVVLCCVVEFSLV